MCSARAAPLDLESLTSYNNPPASSARAKLHLNKRTWLCSGPSTTRPSRPSRSRAPAPDRKKTDARPSPAPQAVKAFTSLTGFTLGDVLAQKGVEGKEERGAGAWSGELQRATRPLSQARRRADRAHGDVRASLARAERPLLLRLPRPHAARHVHADRVSEGGHRPDRLEPHLRRRLLHVARPHGGQVDGPDPGQDQGGPADGRDGELGLLGPRPLCQLPIHPRRAAPPLHQRRGRRAPAPARLAFSRAAAPRDARAAGMQIMYNIFLSFLGNKDAPKDAK